MSLEAWHAVMLLVIFGDVVGFSCHQKQGIVTCDIRGCVNMKLVTSCVVMRLVTLGDVKVLACH